MTGSRMTVPAAFAALMDGRPAAGGPDGATWLRTLPQSIADSFDAWELDPDGAPTWGSTALVLPCRRDGASAVLKLTWPHPDARFEHLALRQWNGRGAVQLLAADLARWALLLERLDAGRTLASVPILDACGLLGALFRDLDAPPVARVADLPVESTTWAAECSAGSALVPRRMTQRAASLLQDLGPGSNKDLVHTDLHYGNVLAARRSPWLAIDPKPINGEWEFAVAPALWNRREEAVAAPTIRAHLRTRLDLICASGGLDQDRARDWSFVRLVLNALWDARTGAPDQDLMSRYLTAAKAMQE